VIAILSSVGLAAVVVMIDTSKGMITVKCANIEAHKPVTIGNIWRLLFTKIL